MTKSKQLSLIVAKSARMFLKRDKRKGVDKLFQEQAFDARRNTRKVADKLVAALTRFSETTSRNVHALQTPSESAREITALLRKVVGKKIIFEEPGFKPRAIASRGGLVSEAVAFSPPDRRLAAFLGRTPREIEIALEAVNAAELDALAAATTIAERVDIAKRYALKRVALEDAGVLLNRFFGLWEAVMSPGFIDAKIGEFARKNSTAQRKLKLLFDQRAKLNEPLGSLAGRAPDPAQIKLRKTAIDKCEKQIIELRTPLYEGLRGLFRGARTNTLKAVIADPEFKHEIEAIGILLTDRRRSVGFVATLSSPGRKSKSLVLNVDHAEVDFAAALDDYIRTGNEKLLRPVLEGSNMRLVSAMENQALLTKLKPDAMLWERVQVSAAKHAGDAARATEQALGSTQGGLALVAKAEAALARELTAEEREFILWIPRNFR